MSFNVCGIPMVMIPHPQGPWLEAITPITNLEWRRGVEPFVNEGAKYGLLEPHYRGDLTVRHFGDYKDLLDTVGHDNAPKNWKGEAIWLEEQGLFILQWRRTTSRKGCDGDGQISGWSLWTSSQDRERLGVGGEKSR